MFRLFGHDRVSILNGGLPAWVAAGGPTESGEVISPEPSNFKSCLNPNYVADWQNVLAVVNDGSAQIVDARSMERFLALAPEPRAGLEGGHIPGSLCIPFSKILCEDDATKFRSVNEIKDVIMDSGVILGAKCVFSCGSGVTAAVVYFAMHLLGIEMNKLVLYDGSWTEWAQNPDLPKIGKRVAK
jgi:thiosulfate/3-mercaptopyruvate sulfurtransferase